MPRFFITSKKIIINEVLSISDDEAKHLKVLRLKEGDRVIISNGLGDEFNAEIIKVSSKEIQFYIQSKKKATIYEKPLLILAQAIPRFSKMELIIQKATELGIDIIFPITTSRSYISKTDLNPNRWARWEKILKEASKQSGRALIPKLTRPLNFSDFLKNNYIPISGKSLNLRLLLWEGEKTQNIKTTLKSFSKYPKSISILIGPEGGFSDMEVTQAKAAGYRVSSLGPYIMRVETAAIAILSILEYEWGYFNF